MPQPKAKERPLAEVGGGRSRDWGRDRGRSGGERSIDRRPGHEWEGRKDRVEQDGLHGARPCVYVVLPSSYAIDDAGHLTRVPREASIHHRGNKSSCVFPFSLERSIHVHTSRLERTTAAM